jgi:hypothetical protein
MNEKALRVLKTLAYGRLEYYDSSICCLYCMGEALYSHLDRTPTPDEITYKHEPQCPIVLSREALAEMGMPPKIYEVTCQIYNGNIWLDGKEQTVATSEEDACALYVTEYGNRIRDIHTTFVGEWK